MQKKTAFLCPSVSSDRLGEQVQRTLQGMCHGQVKKTREKGKFSEPSIIVGPIQMHLSAVPLAAGVVAALRQ